MKKLLLLLVLTGVATMACAKNETRSIERNKRFYVALGRAGGAGSRWQYKSPPVPTGKPVMMPKPAVAFFAQKTVQAPVPKAKPRVMGAPVVDVFAFKTGTDTGSQTLEFELVGPYHPGAERNVVKTYEVEVTVGLPGSKILTPSK